jgi:predicted component of viral defense system (DUF524 family)
MSESLRSKLRKFMSREYREQVAKRDKLRKILKKMRKQQKELTEELSQQNDPQQQDQLRKKLLLIREQRRKGINLLRDLRSEPDKE